MDMKTMWRSLPPVTKNLLIINIAVWVIIQLLPRDAVMHFEDTVALHYLSASNFRPWQLLTYMFVQAQFTHLFFNMFALYMFGMAIERRIGSARFLFYYLSCGLGAALIQMGVFALMIGHLSAGWPEGAMTAVVDGKVPFGVSFGAAQEVYNMIYTPVIGASGAVFGVLLAFGFFYPRQPLYLFFIPVPIQARWFVLGYGALELLLGLSNNPGDNVAHFAHLGGMIAGVIMLLYWRHAERRRNRFF